MLDAQQQALRANAYGSSDIPAILGLVPRQGAIVDVWMQKHKPNQKAIFAPPSPQALVGTAAEHTIMWLYAQSMGPHGKDVHEFQKTLRAEVYGVKAVATPDAVVCPRGGETVDHFVECKMVGMGMARFWNDGFVPPHVYAQVQWQIAVTNTHYIDVARLIGTDFNVHRIERNESYIRECAAAVHDFHRAYIETGMQPAPLTDEQVAALYPRDNGEIDEIPEDDEDKRYSFVELVEAYNRAAKVEKAAVLEKSTAAAALKAMIGDGAGLTCDGFKATWKDRRKAPAYKDIALHLTEGAIPEELLKQHTGTTRVLLVTVPKD